MLQGIIWRYQTRRGSFCYLTWSLILELTEFSSQPIHNNVHEIIGVRRGCACYESSKENCVNRKRSDICNYFGCLVEGTRVRELSIIFAKPRSRLDAKNLPKMCGQEAGWDLL
jgi:hypothetical protein